MAGDNHVDVLGGSGLLREAIDRAWTTPVDGETVAELAPRLGARVTFVVIDHDDRWSAIERRSTSNHHVIAILQNLDVRDFIHAIRRGAHGVVWADTSSRHLAAVTHAALRRDALLPRPVLDALISGDTSPKPDHLDDLDLQVLGKLAQGHTVGSIAESLFINKRTLHRRIASICLRLGSSSPTQAVHVATKAGYI